MDIEARTKRSLEWERLKALLSAEACCDFSRELCSQLPLEDDPQIVLGKLGQAKEALSMLTAGFSLSQEGLPELRNALRRLAAGAHLSATELLDLRRLLVLAHKTKSQLTKLEARDFPQLCLFTSRLHVLAELLKEINRVFDEEGAIADGASPLLKTLRRDVQKLTARIKEQLKHIINSSNVSKALQEPLYTVRNGRYVLPIQASMRSSVPGIVHDSSASGLTVFVEPMAIVELTNDVRLKETELEHEIERLLAELSSLAHAVHPQLQETYGALVEIDVIAAKARLGERYRGVQPELSEDGSLLLRQARHPLLALQKRAEVPEDSTGAGGVPSQVVANDVVLGGDVRTMVITGPNTGGKTVYLKTAGLLSLMLKAGLLLPVAAGSKAVVFSAVFADIGDEQSIEQSLSTFSSHMTGIVEILEKSRSNTLVLLDEIGAGTDPREGAILARVILEHLNGRGALTISTTHYGEMKSLAYTTSGFVNGSFEFDEKNLAPTYHLQIGVPGSSKAIEIAARLGLPPSLVGLARDLAAHGASDASEMMSELERRLAAVSQSEKDLLEKQEMLKLEEEQVQTDRSRLAQEREKLRSQLADRMRQEFSQASEFVRSLIAELQKQPSIAKAQKIQQDLAALRAELNWVDAEPAPAPAKAFGIGQQVRVLSLNQVAIIEELPGDGQSASDGVATVRAGAMKIKVPLSDLQSIQVSAHSSKQAGSQKRAKPPAAVHRHAAVKSSGDEADVFVRTDSNTLDLRGERVEDGLARLERFIDSAFLEHLSPVMVIHGHGTGQLRAAVRKFLSDGPYEATWRAGESYEGGNGVTVIRFGR
jgi:DNA mismatch repair protein MutS2